MSREYAEGRIKEALKKAKGNATKARQQVIAWTYEDSKLLYELTKPHLSGIVAYNIERVLSGRNAAAEQPPPDKPEVEPAPGELFGKELLKAVVGDNTAVFGQENNAPQARRGRASKRHIDAIRLMAGKSKSDKK